MAARAPAALTVPVSARPGSLRPASHFDGHRRPIGIAVLARPLLAAAVLLLLLAAVLGGLVRAGVLVLRPDDPAALGNAAALHAALMLSGFFGTTLAIERAVTSGRLWAFSAPLAAAASGLLLLLGARGAGAGLGCVAAALLAAVSVQMLMAQRIAQRALLLVGALAWLAGQAVFLDAGNAGLAVPFWFAFVVLTLTAQRIEVAGSVHSHPLARPVLALVALVLLAGAGLSVVAPGPGGVVFAAALAALALWSSRFDSARRMVAIGGLSRYVGVCVLAGYGWLGLSGVAWASAALGGPGRDIALHALGLGFVMNLVMAHAPIIVPTALRIKLKFGPGFYLAVLLIQVSLLLRLDGGTLHPALFVTAAALNACSLGVFGLTLAGSALARRRLGARK